MKKIFQLILILILAFSSLKANAMILKDTAIKEAICRQVAEKYRDYTNADISVKVVLLPFKDLEVPSGIVSYRVESLSNKFMPRDLEKVTVYVNNKFVKTFNAPIVVKAWEDVLVATAFINIGQPINSNVATVKRLEISNVLQYPLRADNLGKEIMAKKAFREGEIIDKRFVKQKPDVLRNSTVTVVFNANNLSVSTEATSLSDGVLGESICLMNKKYNKIYSGKVIGENKVLVKI